MAGLSMTPLRLARIALTVALLATVAPACSRDKETAPAPTGDILAYVNKQAIRLPDFEKRFERETAGRNRPTDPLSLLNAKLGVLNQTVDLVLIAQEAAKRGIAVTDAEVEEAVRAVQSDYPPDAFQRMLQDRGLDLAAWKAQFRESLLQKKVVRDVVAPTIQVSEEEMRRLYEARPREFERPAQVHAVQIVVATEAEAKAIHQRLLQGADFGVLAQEVSIAPERTQGGDLGWFGPGQMPPEFDKVVFTLPVGTFSEPVRTPYGFHVFRVLDRREAQRGSFEEVRPVIEASIRDTRLERATATWIAGLREKADIAINESLLGR
jgi:parvulin-like peptidyl-prolyl isomerase